MAYFTSTDAIVLVVVALASLVLSHTNVHRAIASLKELINAHLSAPQAAVADSLLDYTDQLITQPVQHSASEILDVIERLTKIGVVNANVQTVTRAKQAGIFTDAVASSVKSDVIVGVLRNLGQLKTQAETLYGDLSGMIGEYVETHVGASKKGA